MVNIYKDLRGKIFAELKRSFGRSTLFDVNGPLRIENRFKKVFKVEVILIIWSGHVCKRNGKIKVKTISIQMRKVNKQIITKNKREVPEE